MSSLATASHGVVAFLWARLDFRGPATPGGKGSGVVLGHNEWTRLVGKKTTSPKSVTNLARTGVEIQIFSNRGAG